MHDRPSNDPETARAFVTTAAVFDGDFGKVNSGVVLGVVKRNHPPLSGEIKSHQGVMAGFGNVLGGEGKTGASGGAVVISSLSRAN
jgi:hypothetical protein